MRIRLRRALENDMRIASETRIVLREASVFVYTASPRMNDIVESARVASRETVLVVLRFLAALGFGFVMMLPAGVFVAAAYLSLRLLWPRMSDNDALTFAVMTMIWPGAIVAWFAIVFFAELARRRSRRNTLR